MDPVITKHGDNIARLLSKNAQAIQRQNQLLGRITSRNDAGAHERKSLQARKHHLLEQKLAQQSAHIQILNHALIKIAIVVDGGKSMNQQQHAPGSFEAIQDQMKLGAFYRN